MRIALHLQHKKRTIKKRLRANARNRFLELSPACAVFAGIPNLMAQGGHSQFNFGFVELATLTPIKHYPATYACKWFKEYMAISNTAG